MGPAGRTVDMHGALLALELTLTINLTSLSDHYPLRKGYAFVALFPGLYAKQQKLGVEALERG